MEQETTLDFKTTLKGGERVIIHLNLDYMESMYTQKGAKTTEAKKQVVDDILDDIVNFIHGKSKEDYMFAYDFADRNGKTCQSWWLEYIDRDEGVTEEKVYDYYQERSVTAGSRADQLAWMFVLMMTGGLISGNAFKTFSVCTALSAIYVFFSIMQAVWQTFTSWIFKQRIKRADVMPEDYPWWVGSGAWLFFWLKMISISTAAIYFAHSILSQIINK